jgi:dTMP kinase
LFITLEGIDRAGKTTQAKLLARELDGDTLLLREPGGTPASERMRDLLKDPGVDLDPRAELLLFCAARADLVERVIKPALAAGTDVVCDRFVDSTVAYQGVGRGLGVEFVTQLNEAAVAGCEPDLTILLRVDPGEAARRGQLRLAEGLADGSDRFEAEGPEFQRTIAEAYDRIADQDRERFAVVDARGSVEEVHDAVIAAVRGARVPR